MKLFIRIAIVIVCFLYNLNSPINFEDSYLLTYKTSNINQNMIAGMFLPYKAIIH
jgi:hypothetical protein